MSKKTSKASTPTYTYEPDDYRQPPLESEWLLTNGTGSFAMGTVAACNTRRYHGLLVSAIHPPVDRVMTVNTMGEHVHFNDMTWDLSTHEYGAGHDYSMFQPTGWRHLVSFKKDHAVAWLYRVGPIEIERTLRLIWKRQLAVLSYTVRKTRSRKLAVPDSVTLTLRPFCAMRDFHALRDNDQMPGVGLSETKAGWQLVSGEATLNIAARGAKPTTEQNWWHNFHYRADAARGQGFRESLFVPGCFNAAFDPAAKQTVHLCFGTEKIDWDAALGRDARKRHLTKIVNAATEHTKDPDGDLAALAIATDDFVVDRAVGGKASTTIIAGYPWFSDWGRDTMIALPGCLLSTGRFKEAKQTLLTFAAHIKDGLVPNRFDDYGGDPHYNTVDASLWFVHAATEYARLADDKKTWKDKLAKACQSILDEYAAGTHFDIAMDGDGLINAGNEGTQLTWMDAARDGVVFTPRYGKAVEINALWYNGLRACAELLSGKVSARYEKMADRAKRSFNKLFWLSDRNHLADCVTPDGADPALRPNQVFAVSLPHSPLSQRRQQQVMTAVRDKLHTPMGMRTLSPDDPRYHGRYEGSLFERDAAYHQGTAWPWLTGSFIEGWLRAHKFTDKARKQAREMLRPLIDELANHSLGSLHEVYDGDDPQRAQGCIAQAWSVAEALRAAALIERK